MMIYKYVNFNKLAFGALCMSSVVAIASCNSEGGKTVDTPAIDSSEIVVNEYIADNDIAMTVKSIVDAINVGEKLDTAYYNFEGVLTDGEGTPLYTDVQGTPGRWVVDVTNTHSVKIQNLYLGDLLPNHLISYLKESLSLSEDERIYSHDYCDENDTMYEIYDTGDGYIRFETRTALANNGIEGPLMSIIIYSDDNIGKKRL